MPERALRAHPILPALHQPRPWAQLPLFALVQPVHAGGHPDPWLPERVAAGRGPHRPVQSAGPLGVRPRPPEGKVGQPGAEALGRTALPGQTEPSLLKNRRAFSASTAWRAKRDGEVCFL